MLNMTLVESQEETPRDGSDQEHGLGYMMGPFPLSPSHSNRHRIEDSPQWQVRENSYNPISIFRILCNDQQSK